MRYVLVPRPVERDELTELCVLGGTPMAARRKPGLPAAALLVVDGAAGIVAAAALARGGGTHVHGGGADGSEHAATALGRGGGRGLPRRGGRG